MTARDVLVHSLPFNSYQQRNEVIDAYRAEVLREAVALVSLHVDLGAPPQRILTELRRMAPPTKET